ncbi:unnamed protein product [Bursaphelenchus okinawaensis]|uniref:Mitochondrial chaperone BCS1 n=1 Tax=Bursaphelenchus okinawaensis TaxID=465554 RepID=A0A811LHW6_9BILA|nr:unnamed protein product [Bursaphelenchus okinawaensis]CAG9125926.1 unnamed protein product [Bursaphelenchus okinawaensis]
MDNAVPALPVPDSASSQGGLLETYTKNPYFNAGLGLAGLGMAAQLGKRFLIIGNLLFRRRFVTSLTLNNEDASYPWVLDFINKYSKHKARSISASSVISQTESGKVSSSFYLLPGYGTHYFSYDYRFIQVERSREKHQIQKNGVRTALETVTLTTFGSPLIWKDFLHKATVEALEKEETGTVVYNAIGPEWHRMGNPRRKRPIESVILAEGIVDNIIKDIEEFIDSSEWYISRGIPYRRGYLFYGPPGTGKSSLISSLAGHFGYSICILSLSERTLDDDRLSYLLNNTPPNCFILLEDVDAAFVSRDAFENSQHKAYEGMTRVTFSGLLNAIDGVASSDERILFMTTNYRERLDDALVRPGRIDVQYKLDNCTKDVVRAFFIRFYENADDSICDRFTNKVLSSGKSVSPAWLQGYLLIHKDNPELAVKNIEDALSFLK